ncbi:MAG TPA: hypothetical protein VFI96_08030, partial [Longimicrobiaceae bacterium]|nr:hypothetical protein [Longimicrobiaceae bacterium]
HGSREAVREWLDLAPFDVVQRAVYERAKDYRPDGRRRQITTMAYFTGAVADEAERWSASNLQVSDEHDERRAGNPAPAARARGASAGARKPDRFARIVESA